MTVNGKRLQTLSAATTLDGGDLLHILTDPTGAAVDKKITVDDLQENLLPDIQAGVFNATQTINASLGDIFQLTLTGNVTSSSITNALAGQSLSIALTQDGGGGHTFAWPSNVKLSGGSVTLSGANKRDVLIFYYDGTNWWETTRSLNM